MQEWIAVNWSNIIGFVQAFGTVIAAIGLIGVFFQVKVAIGATYDSRRPLLVGIQDLRVLGGPGTPFNLTNPMIKLRNVGSGVATNIVCVLFPSVSSGRTDYSVAKFIDPIMQGEEHDHVGLSPTNDAPRLSGTQKLNKKYSLYAPKAAAARIIITYHDIFGRKHASIFDFFDQWTSQNIAFLPNIRQDLEDLRLSNTSST